MNDFSWLKKCSYNEYGYDNYNPEYKHRFLQQTEEKIKAEEKRMNRKFPGELRDFYLQIGAGSLCIFHHDNHDEIMQPEDVVNFILGEDYFETCSYRDEVDMNTTMVFFSLGDDVYFSLDLTQMDKNGICPIVAYPEYEPVVLAYSLKEFIMKMEKKVDFYEEVL